MNPFLFNYLQNNANQEQQQPMAPTQNMPSQPMQPPQQQYNPFNEGIQRAISAARDSLGLTEKQQDKAMRRSLLAFGNSIGQQPVRKGFWNNFGDIARSMSPAIAEYDSAEDEMMNHNNALANQILDYEAKMEDRGLRAQDRQIAADERKWQHKHAEDMLAEQRRYHNLSEKRHGSSTSKHDAKALEKAENQESLLGFLGNADKLIDSLGEAGYRGRGNRILDNFTPGGTQLTPEQQQIHTLGEVLQGKLFHDWDYTSQAEFAHLPKLSPNNPVKVNKAIIKGLIDATKSQMAKKGMPQLPNMGSSSNIAPSSDDAIMNQLNLQNASQLKASIDPVQQELEAAHNGNSHEPISMVDPNGNIWEIPAADIETALAKGLKHYTME